MPTDNRQACPTELPAFCQQRHWSIYWIFIACSLAVVCGRIMTVQNHQADCETPFFSANDRSRWATVRALVDEKSFHIDDVIERGQTINWDSIDKVKHLGTDEKMHAYSSKPPLLASVVAAGYLAIKTFTGLTITQETFVVTRALLLMLNGVCWFVLLYFLAKTIDCVSVRDWSRYFVLACGGFGTFLSTFAVSLNNHLPAAAAAMATVYCITKISRRSDSRLPQATWRTFLLAGIASALAFANELPALSLLAVAGAVCIWKSRQHTMTAFLPAMAVVLAAFFGTNYAFHGDWKMPYAHRSDGAAVASVEIEPSAPVIEKLDAGGLPSLLEDALPQAFRFSSVTITAGDWPSTRPEVRRWNVEDRLSDDSFVIQHNLEQASNLFSIHPRSNWYEYSGSYWLKSNFERKSLVDQGQQDPLIYMFHVLLGHHGIFSLTPIWILALAGMMVFMFSSRYQLRWFGMMTVLLSVVVVGFYLMRPPMDRNYGGVSSGLRWVFWLYPLWLVCILPMADSLAQSKLGRFFCLALLAASVISVSWSNLNPWVHPWLYQIWPQGLPL
jgi:hypothetical protein